MAPKTPKSLVHELGLRPSLGKVPKKPGNTWSFYYEITMKIHPRDAFGITRVYFHNNFIVNWPRGPEISWFARLRAKWMSIHGHPFCDTSKVLRTALKTGPSGPTPK